MSETYRYELAEDELKSEIVQFYKLKHGHEMKEKLQVVQYYSDTKQLIQLKIFGTVSTSESLTQDGINCLTIEVSHQDDVKFRKKVLFPPCVHILENIKKCAHAESSIFSKDSGLENSEIEMDMSIDPCAADIKQYEITVEKKYQRVNHMKQELLFTETQILKGTRQLQETLASGTDRRSLALLQQVRQLFQQKQKCKLLRTKIREASQTLECSFPTRDGETSVLVEKFFTGTTFNPSIQQGGYLTLPHFILNDSDPHTVHAELRQRLSEQYPQWKETLQHNHIYTDPSTGKIIPLSIDGKQFASVDHYNQFFRYNNNTYAGQKRQQYDDFANRFVYPNGQWSKEIIPEPLPLVPACQSSSLCKNALRRAIEAKFRQIAYLRSILLATADVNLSQREGSNIVPCTCLMQTRDNLRSDPIILKISENNRLLQSLGFDTSKWSQEDLENRFNKLRSFVKSSPSPVQALDIDTIASVMPNHYLIEVPFTHNCMYYAILHVLEKQFAFPTTVGYSKDRELKNVRKIEDSYKECFSKAVQQLRQDVHDKIMTNIMNVDPHNHVLKEIINNLLNKKQYFLNVIGDSSADPNFRGRQGTILELRVISSILNINIQVVNAIGQMMNITAHESRQIFPHGKQFNTAEAVSIVLGLLKGSHFVGFVPKTIEYEPDTEYERIQVAVFNLSNSDNTMSVPVACIINDLNQIEAVGKYKNGKIQYVIMPPSVILKLNKLWEVYQDNPSEVPIPVDIYNYWYDRRTNKFYTKNLESLGTIQSAVNPKTDNHYMQLNFTN